MTVAKRRFTGLAPQKAQVEDVVAIVYGLPAPMLLRKSEDVSDDGNDMIDSEEGYQMLSEREDRSPAIPLTMKLPYRCGKAPCLI